MPSKISLPSSGSPLDRAYTAPIVAGKANERIYTRLTLRNCLWGLFLVLSGTVGVWGVLNHPWYKERLYAPMPLSRLVHLKAQSPDDPVLLYYRGKRLNEQGRQTEAISVLEHAASLDGSSPRI